jgi:hypothetical protein
VAVVQYTEYREWNINNSKKKNNWKCGPCRVIAFALQLRKKHGKTSVREVESTPISWWQLSSTYLHTNSTQNNTMRQNIQNGTYITIRIIFTLRDFAKAPNVYMKRRKK